MVEGFPEFTVKLFCAFPTISFNDSLHTRPLFWLGLLLSSDSPTIRVAQECGLSLHTNPLHVHPPSLRIIKIIRIIVILLLLIVSSTILELIQSFLPIPDMISSAALAIVVGIFIGWEEKIVSSLIEGSASIQDTVPDFLGEGDGQ